jgi:hypothetical protein
MINVWNPLSEENITLFSPLTAEQCIIPLLSNWEIATPCG